MHVGFKAERLLEFADQGGEAFTVLGLLVVHGRGAEGLLDTMPDGACEITITLPSSLSFQSVHMYCTTFYLVLALQLNMRGFKPYFPRRSGENLELNTHF